MSAAGVIAAARGELGNTELPAGSNRQKYGEAFGWDGVRWCVIFLWWCFRQAGESAAFFGGAKTASCGTLLRWYQEQKLTVPIEQVQPGDIVILNFHGTQDTEHCGLVVETAPLYPTIGWIKTIEGNTPPGEEGSQDNGGSVALKRRYPRQIVGVCRPQYKAEPEPELTDNPPDWAGHWAEDAIRWAISSEYMTGYKDGTWKPDKPVTRAELATVLRRLEEKK